MPYKKPNIEKIHYSIGEVAKIFNVNTSLLRYWEKEFYPYIKPFKNKKGKRYYTKNDIDIITYIYHLTKEKKLTIEGVKQALKEKDISEIANNAHVISKLKQIKNDLLEIIAKLNELKNEQEQK